MFYLKIINGGTSKWRGKIVKILNVKRGGTHNYHWAISD